MNYDPNLTNSGRMAKQTVELVFQVWDNKATYTETVGGNTMGLSVIDCAVGMVYDNLEDHPYNAGTPVIYLIDDKGERLECADEENEGEDWLKAMLVSAKIVAIEPDTAR